MFQVLNSPDYIGTCKFQVSYIIYTSSCTVVFDVEFGMWNSELKKVVQLLHMKWNHEIAHFLLSGGVVITKDDYDSVYKSSDKDEIEKIQRKQLADLPSMLSLLTEVELSVEAIAKSMHEYGIHIDKEKLTNLKEKYEETREVLIKSITDKLGPINLNSPKQLGQVLVLEHKLNLPKTKTGQYMTSSDVLTPYVEKYAVVREILEFRALDKIINTYITPILDRLDCCSRIHPRYDQMSAATGRLASHDPNIQSTPVSGIYGEAIRSVFTSPSGSKLISFDYSQQELRILAHLSGDKELHDAFAKNIDVHILTASRVLDIPIDKVGKAERNIGKTLNFGIVYGETSYGLSRQLGKSPEECAGILKRYFETYSGVKRYFDNLLIHAKIHGYIETILGRRRGIPGQKMYTPKKSLLASEERILKNFPIQGSAADMTKRAMVNIWKNVMPKYPQAHMVMQIHDELVFEYSISDEGVADRVQGVDKYTKKQEVILSLPKDPEKNLNDFIKDVKATMENALTLSVPVVVDAKVGGSWGEI